MTLLRSFVLLLLLQWILPLSILGGAFKPAARPNILWIVTDDMGPELGCYGLTMMRTPNIDRLAAEGARFTRCFTTAPVCSPSRSAIMAGMYQTTINAHQHRSMTTLPVGVKPITDYFRQAGYFTANLKRIGPDLESKGKTDLNFRTEDLFDGEDLSELKRNQPFFAQYQIYEPHRGSWKPGEKLPDRVSPEEVILPPYYPDHPVVRKDWAGYLNAINYLDGKVGTVLRFLEKEGLADNTIVFFFADNGRCHVRDKQWLYEGGLHIPLIVRWPNGLKPGTVSDDLVSAIDISATSLYLAGIKLPVHIQGQIFLGPEAKERKFVFGARDRCDMTVDRIRSVRDERYKYIHNYMPERPYTQFNEYKERAYPAFKVMKQLHAEGKLTPEQSLFFSDRKPEEELYDLKKDPHELRNLAQSPSHQKIKRKLQSELEQWMAACDDYTGKQGAMRK